MYSFVSKTGPFAMAYVQAEEIQVGSSAFAVDEDGVLQILGQSGETITLDTELWDASSSIAVGSGQGNDRITDVADWTTRSDTVVYKAQALLPKDAPADHPLASVAELFASIGQIVRPTRGSLEEGGERQANTFTVQLPGQTDTLEGVERLRFETLTQTVDVALVGNNALGRDGYASLADAVADAASTEVVMVFDESLAGLDRSVLVNRLDGMIRTVDGEVALQLPGSSAAIKVNGLHQVLFASSDADHPVRVLVVGADGFQTIDEAVTAADRGDVIYISDSALQAPTTYVVQKEGMVFMGYSSRVNFAAIDAVGAKAADVYLDEQLSVYAGQRFQLDVNGVKVSYTAQSEESMTDVAQGLANALRALNGLSVTYSLDEPHVLQLSSASNLTVRQTALPAGADLLTLELGYVDVAPDQVFDPRQDAQVKSLVLLGDADMAVLGNALSNVIVGNRGDNTVYAGDGNDVVSTGGGSDRIYGEMGNDLLVADKGVGTEVALLSGGAGNDLLVAATTANAQVVMNGGTGGDTFKVGSLEASNGNLALKAVINDLSARAGDDLDLSQVLSAAGQSAALSSLSKSYSAGNQVFSFNNDVTTGPDSDLPDATVKLLGELRIEMTTESNVTTAFVNPGESAQALSPLTVLNQNVATDVAQALASALAAEPSLVADASVQAEVAKLLPMFEHQTTV
jgi:hypothetical protein